MNLFTREIFGSQQNEYSIFGSVAEDDYFIIMYLTFSHWVEEREGITESKFKSRLWFALSLFSYDRLPTPEQLLVIRCHVCVLTHRTLTT